MGRNATMTVTATATAVTTTANIVATNAMIDAATGKSLTAQSAQAPCSAAGRPSADFTGRPTSSGPVAAPGSRRRRRGCHLRQQH